MTNSFLEYISNLSVKAALIQNFEQYFTDDAKISPSKHQKMQNDLPILSRIC